MFRIRILMQPVWAYLAKLRRTVTTGWSDFWFTPTDPATLATIRIFAGLVVLYIYLSCAPERLNLIGPHGWVDAHAVSELKSLGSDAPTLSGAMTMRWWGQSVWNHVHNDTVASLIYWYFVAAAMCMTVGFFSRTANLLVVVGHLSFVHRSYVSWFGMDSILAMILLYMLIGPSGGAFSVDSLLRRRRRRKSGHEPADGAAIPLRWQANFSVRMIQIHMCVIYLCSGLAKLQGETWWDGTAVLRSLMGYELAPVNLLWLGWFSDTSLEWFSSLSVVATLVFEIGFCFLIWRKLLRPIMLAGAVVLHIGIGVLMGLVGFGAIMVTGCTAFIAPESIRWVVSVLCSGTAEPANDTVPEHIPSDSATA
ncbi:MAG: HTTM domain-containing protein [Planctomycetaceae bacterium]